MADPAKSSGVSVQDLIRQTATGLGVPPELALAVAEHESSFNPTAVGPEIKSMPGVRAIGTFQLLPDTAKRFGVDPSDPAQNITGGVRYLRQLLDENEGDLHAVLKTYGGFVKADPTEYQTKILGSLSKYQQPAGTAPPAPPLGPAGRQGGAGPVGTPGAPVGPGGRTGGPGGGGGMTSSMATLPDVEQIVKPFDPRYPEGRQNLAATAGAVGVSMLTKNLPLQGVTPWIARAIAGPLGAAFGGAAAEATEQAMGQTPNDPNAVTMAGVKQGAYEAGGQMMLWPVRHLFKMAVTPGIAKNAREALNARLGRVIETSKQQSAAQRIAAQDVVDVTRAVGKAQVDAAAVAGRTVTRAAKTAAADRLAQVEIDNADVLMTARREYDNLLRQPPAVGNAGTAVQNVLEGPAKRALDLAGERVSAAAMTGPDIATQPLKDALTELTEKFRPASIFSQVAEAADNPIGFAGVGAGTRDALVAKYGSQEAAEQALGIAKVLNVAPDHPLPGILGKVQAAPETMTFADAHKLKMLLDESVNWDQTARKHLEKMTKGLRVTLREMLGGYDPYNSATAAYQAVVPLYRRGVGKQLSRAIQTPGGADKIAKTLNVKQPETALTIRNLLVDQAAAGGDKAAGQEAWDTVRAHFVHDKLIQGGIEGIDDRLKAMLVDHPEFSKTVFGDLTGLRVISNLEQLGAAYKAAVGMTDVTAQATKDAGKTAEQIVRDTVAQSVRDARAAAAQATAGAKRNKAESIAEFGKVARGAVATAKSEQKKFAESSVGRASSSTYGGGETTDAMRVAMLGPTSKWGLYSLVRLMRGPQSADLLQYAAHSPKLTQQLVSIMHGQAPDRLVSDTLREVMGLLSPGAPEPAVAQEPRNEPVAVAASQ